MAPGWPHLLAATAQHDTRDLDEAQDVVCIGPDREVRHLTRTDTTVNLPTASPDGATVYYVGIGDLGGDLNDARGKNVALWSVPFAGGRPRASPTARSIDLDDGRTRPLRFRRRTCSARRSNAAPFGWFRSARTAPRKN